MNIFENHFKEIENLVLKNKSHLNLKNIDNLKNVSLETPPSKNSIKTRNHSKYG